MIFSRLRTIVSVKLRRFAWTVLLGAFCLDSAVWAAPVAPAEGRTILLDSFVVSPYSNPYASHQGICTAIVEAVFQKLNTRALVAFHPLIVSVGQLKDFQAVGVYPVYPSSDLGDEVLLSDSLLPIKFFTYRLGASQESLAFEGGKNTQQSNASYCVPKIFKRLKGLKAYLEGQAASRVDYEEYAQSCYVKLRLGKIDVVIDEEKSAFSSMAYVFDQDAVRVIKSDAPILQSSFHLAMRKGLPGVVEAMGHFNEALKTIKQTGVIATILTAFQTRWAIEG